MDSLEFTPRRGWMGDGAMDVDKVASLRRGRNWTFSPAQTFGIVQAFYPDQSKWDKRAKALGDAGARDPAVSIQLVDNPILSSLCRKPDQH